MYLTNSQTIISQLLASLPTELGGSPARSPKSGDHTCHGTPQTNRYVQVRCFSFFAMLYSMYLTNLRVFFMQRKATNIKTHKVSSYLNIADASNHPNSFPTSFLTPHFYLRLYSSPFYPHSISAVASMTAPTTRTGAAKAGPCTRPHHGPRRGHPASHRPAPVHPRKCCHMVKCSFVCFFYFFRACVIIFPPISNFYIVPDHFAILFPQQRPQSMLHNLAGHNTEGPPVTALLPFTWSQKRHGRRAGRG